MSQRYQHRDTAEVFTEVDGQYAGREVVIVVDQDGQLKQYLRERLEPVASGATSITPRQIRLVNRLAGAVRKARGRVKR